jgi:hypothetical protein
VEAETVVDHREAAGSERDALPVDPGHIFALV